MNIRNVIRNPRKSQEKGRRTIKDISFVVDAINNAALERNIEEIEKLINSIDIGEQLGIHGLINLRALEVITHNRLVINIQPGVKEHIIWFYLNKLGWSEESLLKATEIYNEVKYLALESLVVSAIKNNEVEESQIQRIENVFNTKEIKKQIQKWNERKVEKRYEGGDIL